MADLAPQRQQKMHPWRKLNPYAQPSSPSKLTIRKQVKATACLVLPNLLESIQIFK